MKGKESQIKELQSKLESGEGCKYIIFCILGHHYLRKILGILGSLGSIVIMAIWPGLCKTWECEIGGFFLLWSFIRIIKTL
jgi:hypothetical protein